MLGAGLAVFVAAAACAVPTTPTTPAPPVTPAAVVTIGTSVEGRPIAALHRPDPDGDPRDAARVLVIGVIHGDETAGRAVVARLASLPLPDDVVLYLVESMNPDGEAADRRTNAHLVDLNRNFPYDWGPIAAPGDWQYAGPAAASEPETAAVVTFITGHRPDLVIWYHQDAFMIAPAEGREGAVRARYAELTGLPMDSVSGGTYTGVAATWARHELAANEPEPGVAFIVELGPTLAPADADRHADAVLTVAAEL